MDTIRTHAQKLGSLYPRDRPPQARQKINSAKQIARMVLSEPDILDVHRRILLSLVQWFISESDGKYSTRFRSRRVVELAREAQPPDVKINHEHVFTRAYIVQRMIDEPHLADSLLDSVVGCIVTEDEHRRLVDGIGWQRYVKAGVAVLDMTAPEERLFDPGAGATNHVSDVDRGENEELRELVEDERLYQLGEPYNPQVEHNIRSWAVITSIVGAYGAVPYEQLAIAVQQHSSGGGRGFVNYCISRRYLVSA